MGLEIGFISLKIEVSDWIDELCWNSSGLDWTLMEHILFQDKMECWKDGRHWFF